MHRSAPQLMLIVLLLGLILMRESHDEPLARVEEYFTNWLAANTGRTTAPAPLVLVEIRDSSLDNKHPWPWLPLDFALFLDNAMKFNPRVVAVEPVMAWNPRELSPEARLNYPQFETILHDRILQAPKAILGAELGFPEDSDVVPPLQPVPILRKISGSVKDIPAFTSIEREPKEDLRLSASLGFTNIPADQSPVRKAPLLFIYRGQVVPSFVLQALMLWRGLTPDDVSIEMGKEISLANRVIVPIDSSGAMLVDFKSPFARISFDELLVAGEQMESKAEPLIKPETIAYKLALLARTDSAARTLDLPIGRKGSPGELLAAAIATVQTLSFIRRIDIWFDAVIIVCMMLLSWYLHRRPRRMAFAIMGMMLVLYLMIGLAIFESNQLALPLTLPFGLGAFIVLFRLFAPREGIFFAK